MSTFLAIATIGGFVLWVVAFWPRVSIEMLADPDPLVWHYAVKNDSFLALSDLLSDCEIRQMVLGGGIHMTGFRGNPGPIPPIKRLGPNERHTFECTLIGGTLGVATGGTVAIDIRYRYFFGLFPRSARACFELVAPRDGSPQWIARACD